MTQPSRSYQPYQPLPPLMGVAPPPKASGGGLTSLIAGILAVLAAGLAFGGSFAAITTFRNTFDGSESTVTANDISWWSLTDAGSSSPFEKENLLTWLVLLLAALVLLVGAAFAFAASSTRSPGPTTGSRTIIAAGTGVLLGAMLLESLEVLRQASLYNDKELEPGESLDFSVGLGFVLPLCGLALGLVAVVLAHVGQGPRVRREPNTPRMGFPAPYGYPGAPQMGHQGAVPMGAPTGAAGTPAGGVPVGAAAAAAAAERPTDVALGSAVEEEDNSGDTTQVVSSATASGGESVASTLAGESTPATPSAAVTPPAPVVPPVPSGHSAPAAPPAAPQTAPASPATPQGGQPAAAQPPAPATPAGGQTQAPQTTPPSASEEGRPPSSATAQSPASPAGWTPHTPPATPAGGQPAPSSAAAPSQPGPATPAGGQAQAPQATPSAPTAPAHGAAEAPQASPAAPAGGEGESSDVGRAEVPEGDKPASSLLSGLPAAPPPPELADEDKKDGK